MPELLLRPDLGRKAYRLRCRFVIDAAPVLPHYRAIWERELEKAKYKAAELFVRDMARDGWAYLDGHGVTMTGPFPATVTVASRPSEWHIPSRDLMAAAHYRFSPPRNGNVLTVPLLEETGSWEFELAAVFSRDTIVMEYPDKREEQG